MPSLATSPTALRSITAALILAALSALAFAASTEARQPPPLAEPEIICVEPMAEPVPAPLVIDAIDPMPRACVQYGRAIEAFASCDAVPQESRDALRTAWQAAQQSFANVSQESIPALIDACTAGRDAIVQATAQLCPNVVQY